MERSKNELFLTFVPRGQSTLMTKCVAPQILRNWLDIFSTYLDIYSSDVEKVMEAELKEQKHFVPDLLKVQKKGNKLISMNVGR